MRNVRPASLLEALHSWGIHELSGRVAKQVNIDAGNAADVLNFILCYRARLIAKILARQPMSVRFVELDPADASSVRPYSSTDVRAWVAAVTVENGDSLQHYNALVAGDRPISGALIGVEPTPTKAKNAAPGFTLYDGLHRAAAWRSRLAAGDQSSIVAYLIETEE
jgi:hypothetical protein